MTCIDEWTKKSPICPICREDVPSSRSEPAPAMGEGGAMVGDPEVHASSCLSPLSLPAPEPESRNPKPETLASFSSLTASLSPCFPPSFKFLPCLPPSFKFPLSRSVSHTLPLARPLSLFQLPSSSLCLKYVLLSLFIYFSPSLSMYSVYVCMYVCIYVYTYISLHLSLNPRPSPQTVNLRWRQRGGQA